MRSRNNFGPKNLPRQYPLSAQIEFSFYVAKQAKLSDEKIVDIIAKTNTSVIKGNGHPMSNKLDFLFEVYKAQYLSEPMKIALLNHQNYWKNTDYFKGILREDKGYTKEFLEFLGKNAKNRGVLFAAVRTNTSVNAETLKNAVGRYIAVKLNALLKDKKETEKNLKYGSKSGEPNLLNNKEEQAKLANCEKKFKA
ncbi:MAG: hypothetical protein LBG46_00385 [Elusimicrobiota bacterium]|nr:hypothetical protein [Elusimicrobiota bacterium]